MSDGTIVSPFKPIEKNSMDRIPRLIDTTEIYHAVEKIADIAGLTTHQTSALETALVDYAFQTKRPSTHEVEYPYLGLALSFKIDAKNVRVDENRICMSAFISSVTASPLSKWEPKNDAFLDLNDYLYEAIESVTD